MKPLILMAICTLTFASGLLAQEAKDLATAKRNFAQVANPDEAARVHYVASLAALREKLARSNGDWQSVDAELRKHPAPKNANSGPLGALLVGHWVSPRHEYLFRKDGTWTMLPAEPDATRGKWKIQGNQYIDMPYLETGKPENWTYTIILLTAKDFIYTDGKIVFYEKKK